MKVVHVITGLETGGAEMMLYKLISSFDRENVNSSIISLTPPGPLGVKIEAEGIPVHSIGMKRSWTSVGALKRLKQYERQLSPDIIQGWMYHGNIAASLMAFFSNRSPGVIWNIRHSLDNIKADKHLTRVIMKIGAFLSSRADGIIYNSRTSSHQHESIGYNSKHTYILPNGFDTELFRPSTTFSLKVRKELGLKASDKMIGVVARYHPVKGHHVFLQAAKIIHDAFPEAFFLFVGAGTGQGNQGLKEEISKAGLKESFHLLGERDDIEQIIASLDMLVCPSLSEGFPNVLGEAMSCEVPCISSDVGDASYILDDIGKTVPPSNPKKLAEAIIDLLQQGSGKLEDIGKKGRERIIRHFSLPSVTSQYEDLYRRLYDESLQ